MDENQTLTFLQTYLRHQENHANELTRKVLELTTKLEIITNALVALQNNKSESSDELLQATQTALENTAQERDEVARRLNDLNNELHATRMQRDEYSREVSNSKTVIDELYNRVRELEQKNQHTLNMHLEECNKSSVLQNDLNTQNNNYNLVQEENNKLRTLIDQLTNRCNELADQKNEMKIKLEDFANKCLELEKQHDELIKQPTKALPPTKKSKTKNESSDWEQ